MAVPEANGSKPKLRVARAGGIHPRSKTTAAIFDFGQNLP
jgi:hypothetical protein